MLRVTLAVLVVVSGWASQYRPGAMEATIHARQNGHPWGKLPSQLPQVDGYIATCDCSDIGQIRFVKRAGTQQWERFLVVDCGGPQLRDDGLTGCEWMEQNNIICEIGHATAGRWRTVGRGVEVMMLWWQTITVSDSEAPQGPHIVIREVYE